MARTYTIEKLVQRVRRLSDNEHQEHVTDPELKEYIAAAYEELYEILVDSGMRYFESEQTISTDGSAAYALPSDYMATLGVDYEWDTSGGRRQLRELMAQERNYYTGINALDQAVAYEVVGSDLKLAPSPPTGQTYFHVYIPQPTDYADAGDEVSVDVVLPGAERFVVWTAVVETLAKSDENTGLARSKAKEHRDRVEHRAIQKAMLEPRRVIVRDDLPDMADWLPGDYVRGNLP